MSQASTRAFTREPVRLGERYGPWAVVTGASDGIGREFAARLALASIWSSLFDQGFDRHLTQF